MFDWVLAGFAKNNNVILHCCVEDSACEIGVEYEFTAVSLLDVELSMNRGTRLSEETLRLRRNCTPLSSSWGSSISTWR